MLRPEVEAMLGKISYGDSPGAADCEAVRADVAEKTSILLADALVALAERVDRLEAAVGERPKRPLTMKASRRRATR